MPIFIRCGLSWEAVEAEYLHRYLDALRYLAVAAGLSQRLHPLVVLDQPIADVYGPHWSITGSNVPIIGSAEEAVFLPGRNVLLLAKSLLWCHLQGVPAIALGSLQTNPFPDATPEFFRGIQDLLNQAMQGSVEVRLPLGGMKKVAVMSWAARYSARATVRGPGPGPVVAPGPSSKVRQIVPTGMSPDDISAASIW